ncbi:helix-turn-helix domain-containing protein [Arthrobacter sp. AL08]|uniref:helix-turn-helix domain-containing protein n=1 Tax=unclassified Arthrobacter TaxID=235627 RepID=UPI00249BDC71|nr:MULTISPECIES: helix-turn-helix domain-containing protein [unclassified Arthrobacter]MDI3243327.1 helix-turn-helix domain-containing protein [Arthrobacter sp. AL05]MDI3279336.1 helix-turn-helix domain-containing protein [Arthrobacter sp. AL08]
MLRSVAVIALPGLSPFEFGVVCEVFGLDRSDQGTGLPAFDFRVCTPCPGLLQTDIGFSILVEYGLDAADDADLVIMAPYHSGAPTPPAVIDLLRRADARGARILSVCNGAFALAEAGILDGRRATTHWKHSRQLAASFPQVTVDENVLYLHDGNVITSAGTAAGIDACLHLIRTEFGAKAASTIARGMVVPPHRDGGQAQYIDRPVPVQRGDTMEKLLVWMDEHLHAELPVSRLASRMHMSERTFARRFRAETGATPGAWVNSQRLLRVQTLLEETDLSIEAIASAAGFGQAVLLRHHFHKRLGISPTAYRRTFRGQGEPTAAAV